MGTTATPPPKSADSKVGANDRQGPVESKIAGHVTARPAAPGKKFNIFDYINSVHTPPASKRATP